MGRTCRKIDLDRQFSKVKIFFFFFCIAFYSARTVKLFQGTTDRNLIVLLESDENVYLTSFSY